MNNQPRWMNRENIYECFQSQLPYSSSSSSSVVYEWKGFGVQSPVELNEMIMNYDSTRCLYHLDLPPYDLSYPGHILLSFIIRGPVLGYSVKIKKKILDVVEDVIIIKQVSRMDQKLTSPPSYMPNSIYEFPLVDGGLPFFLMKDTIISLELIMDFRHPFFLTSSPPEKCAILFRWQVLPVHIANSLNVQQDRISNGLCINHRPYTDAGQLFFKFLQQ